MALKIHAVFSYNVIDIIACIYIYIHLADGVSICKSTSSLTKRVINIVGLTVYS